MLDCPWAKSDMTPCIRRDGELAADDRGCCVGCGERIGPETGGGDAPVDMSMEAVKARLATYQPLGSKAKGVADLAIAPDEPFEQDGADPTQTGGGDAAFATMPEMDCIITIELRGEDAERACELYDALEGLLWKMGEIGLLSMRTERPQTGNIPQGTSTYPGVPSGGGDAGKRAMDVAEFNHKTSINKRVTDRYNELMREGKHGAYETLFRIVHEERRDSHREGAKAMREACAQLLDECGTGTNDERVLLRFAAGIRALPIPGKTE